MKANNLLTENQNYINRLFSKFQTVPPKKHNMMIACGKLYTPVRETLIEGVNYYEFMFECERAQNTSDIIHVIIESLPRTHSLKFTSPGEELTLIGFLRSINWHDETGKRHLDVVMQAVDFEFHTVYTEENFDKNIAILSGYICTEPTFKVTGTNRQIAEFRIAVRNNANEESDYLPIIVWGSKALEVSEHYKVGDKLRLLGRVQSRVYYKKFSETEGEHRVAYEISTRYMIHHSK